MSSPPASAKPAVRAGVTAAWLLAALGLCVGAAQAQAPQADLAAHLQGIRQLADEALAASRAAQQAGTVADVKRHADAVFAAVWGVPSGLAGEARGAEAAHGWKTQWQVDGSEFDPAMAERYGTLPPAIGDPAKLGIVGRGRHARKQLEALMEDAGASDAGRLHAGHVVASLNNVIGWMKIDDGVTKAERQPRVDLTREWDAPSAFWLSTADTGWLFEVYAQALNLLKTDYEGDVATARRHAADMTALLEKALNGVDANGNGSVEPVMMEGGLTTAFQHAGLAGLLSP